MATQVQKAAGYLLLLIALVGAGVWIARPVLREGRVRVLRVVDGDTLKVISLGRPERVRLIGLDAPESADNIKARLDARRTRGGLNAILFQGQQAKHYVETLVKPGNWLRLEFDAEKRDKYGRLLAYVYLPDGRMLNDLIVRNGYARLMPVLPNAKYEPRFQEDFKKAKEEKAGIWKGD